MSDARSVPSLEQRHGAAIFPNSFEEDDEMHLLLHEAQPEEDPGSEFAFPQNFFGLTTV